MSKSNGESVQNISVSMSYALAKRLSSFCFKKDLPVSSVAKTALKRYLAAEMATEDSSFWDEVYDKYEKESKL